MSTGGKGDAKRPVDAEKWASNWDKINWGKKDTPKKEKPKK
jgi:hypothetical protein